MPEMTIRPATVRDAAALAAIYAPFVEQTAISFEEVSPTVEEFARRIEKSLSRWQWLVAETEAGVAGYAYGSPHRERAAYRWSVEVSAYVDPRFQRQGIARAMYAALFDDLAEKGFCTAFAGITLPNEASVALHTAVGFEAIGVFRSIGWKFDRWHDVAWFNAGCAIARRTDSGAFRSQRPRMSCRCRRSGSTQIPPQAWQCQCRDRCPSAMNVVSRREPSRPQRRHDSWRGVRGGSDCGKV